MIRPLTVEDTPALVNSREFFPDGWNEDMIISAFNGGRLVGYVDYEEDKIRAYLTASITIDEADIESVFTFPEFRKKGIAFSLIQKFLEEYPNLKKIFLEVRQSNIPAINAYKKAGFNQISVRKKYYSDGEDALILIKEN